MSISFYPGYKEKGSGYWTYPKCSYYEVNLSNDNADIILRLHPGYGTILDPYVGHISFDDFQLMVDKIDNPEFQRPTKDPGPGPGPRIIDMGVTLDQLRRYEYHLQKVLDQARLMPGITHILYG